MTQHFRGWTRKHSVQALALLIAIQICLIIHFRVGLVGSDDMTAAFSGKRLVQEFDMTEPFTNCPMSVRIGMGLPLGILQLFFTADTAIWLFPLLCAIPLAPLAYQIGRQLKLSRPYSLVLGAAISCTPVVIFNSSVSLTEVPLLVVTLAALLCFLKGIPDSHQTAQDNEETTHPNDVQPKWSYRWLAAAGICCGILFLIKISAVALAASLIGYAFLRQIGQWRMPYGAIVVGLSFGAILVGEMGLWRAMSGDPLYRVSTINAGLSGARAAMKRVYQQNTQDDILAKYSRYAVNFVGKRARFGNLFPLFFVGWVAACLFAKRYRMFLLLYGGPQLFYLWYLVTFYPSTQPRYAIQFLPFVVLGTLLLIERWQWSKTGWGTALVLVLVGQNLALGMRTRSNRYRTETIFFSRYTHEKIKNIDVPTYVDARTVSIFHTLNNFEPRQQETLSQYPLYRNRNLPKNIREEALCGGFFPWRESELEAPHGFVTVDLRLVRWLRKRLRNPESIYVPPKNWILVDYAHPKRRPDLAGLVYYASPDITTERFTGDSDIKWNNGPKWYRIREQEKPQEVHNDTLKFQMGDTLVLGTDDLAKPGLIFPNDRFTENNELYTFVEFDCTFKPEKEGEMLCLPRVHLFKGTQEVAVMKYPEVIVQEGRQTLRYPVRISDLQSALRLQLIFMQNCDVAISSPRVFVQHLRENDAKNIARYHGVQPKLKRIVTLPSSRAIH